MIRPPEVAGTESDHEQETRPISTLPPARDLASVRRGRFGRRLFVVALVVFLALGLLGLLGVHTRDARATGGGYQLTVHYADISRPGLATPWSVEIRRPGGFGDGLVTVAVDAAYFDAFDENGFDPDPVGSISEGERTIWRFEPPSGDTMTVSLDARIEPGVQLTRLNGSVSVLDPSDAVVATVDFHTLVLP